MIPTDQPELSLEVFKTVLGKGSGSLLRTEGGTDVPNPSGNGGQGGGAGSASGRAALVGRGGLALMLVVSVGLLI